MPGKRKYSALTTPPAPRAKYSKYGKSMMKKVGQKLNVKKIDGKVNRLYRMIETKEASSNVAANTALPHNQVHVAMSLFSNISSGTGDPMNIGGNRIGDSLVIRGVAIRGFFENALARPKVYYRVMVVKCAKGDILDRGTLFKGVVGNKMIDQMNTERFTIIAQKIFNISASNIAASGAEVPSGAPITASAGGQGTKTFKMWIPGKKFCRGGYLQYENGSNQPKFFDYRVVILAYDWYGTPQDVNNVGRINDMYHKVYFKDA